MPLIIPANSITGGYTVDNSLRFNSGSSDYLNRTFSTGNRRTFTYSGWCKRPPEEETAFLTVGTGTTRSYIFITSSKLTVQNEVSSSVTTSLQTNAVYRDSSAWQHIVVAVDTTQGTEANRIKIYVNGEQITSFGTSNYPSQNEDFSFNNNIVHEIGRTPWNSGNLYDGYFCEIVWIDGQQLAPTDFGEFDEDSGIWKPIDVSGLTFGTNGFYLDFEDSGALGDDVSGNGNDFTVNNLTAIDQTTDTPTNNFATLNSLENFYPAATISEGNLKAVTVTAKYTFLRSSIGVSSGKWYMETKCTAQSGSTNKWTFGITDHGSTGTQNYIGQNSYSYGWRGDANSIFYNGTSANYGSGAMATGNIIGMALDLDNNKIYWSINGTWKNSGDPAGNSNGFSITAPASTNNGYYHFAFGDIDGDQNFTYETNFGSPPFAISSGNTDGNGYGNFEYAVPSGYLSLCTKNLSEVLG
jgi:hypothetical protein